MPMRCAVTRDSFIASRRSIAALMQRIALSKGGRQTSTSQKEKGPGGQRGGRVWPGAPKLGKVSVLFLPGLLLLCFLWGYLV